MNILYRASDSRDNYQANLLENLRAKGGFDKCTVVVMNDEHDTYPAEYYNVLYASDGYFCKYEDYDSLPAVPLTLWEALLPYKDDMLNMTQRTYHYHLLNYVEMDDLYIKHIRYWNYILDRDEIGMAYFVVAPHACWEYAIYALCKVKGIPTLIVDELWQLNLGTVCTRLDHNGFNAAKCYELHDNIELDDNLGKWYEKTKSSGSSYDEARMKKEYKTNSEFEKSNFMGTMSQDLKDMGTQLLRYIYRGGKTTDDLVWTFRFRSNRIKGRRLYKKYTDIWYYDKKYAVHPVEGEEYILYPMQQMPEATLLPKAGVCANQLTAIQLLASAAAKRGVKLYVKEHFVQFPREPVFYEELLRIPNVRLIHIGDPTGEIQDKALAIACQTGTCLAEGLVKGIPIMCTSASSMVGDPGSFRITAEPSVLDAIDAIRAGLDLKPENSKKFFAAFGKTCIRHFLDWRGEMAYSKEEMAGDTIDLILAFQAAGMPEDFYYEREV